MRRLVDESPKMVLLKKGRDHKKQQFRLYALAINEAVTFESFCDMLRASAILTQRATS